MIFTLCSFRVSAFCGSQALYELFQKAIFTVFSLNSSKHNIVIIMSVMITVKRRRGPVIAVNTKIIIVITINTIIAINGYVDNNNRIIIVIMNLKITKRTIILKYLTISVFNQENFQ